MQAGFVLVIAAICCALQDSDQAIDRPIATTTRLLLHRPLGHSSDPVSQDPMAGYASASCTIHTLSRRASQRLLCV
jgi:hypothetical protein